MIIHRDAIGVMAEHDRNLVHELGQRSDSLWRYDNYIANAEGKPHLQAYWRELKLREQQIIDDLKQLVQREIAAGCF